MKQARRWLLLAAALVLLPQAAYAQKKKPPKGAAPSGCTSSRSGFLPTRTRDAPAAAASRPDDSSCSR